LHRTLGGKVAYIQLDAEGPSIQGPVIFSFGDEAAHLGLLVHWIVKENVNSEITLGN
jgi:hypothetical protein